MNDLDLFKGLAKRVPLEPITDAETYYAACDMQEELREMKETPVSPLPQGSDLLHRILRHWLQGR